jgi:uncharacterized phage protein (TIGR01671 family)
MQAMSVRKESEMNRTIKFRAWHKEYKIMRQILSLEMEPKEYPEASTRIAIYTVFDHPSIHAALIKARFAKWRETDCEIMQYTGLHDKNGKEIYEGDILEVDWEARTTVHAVEWGGDYPAFELSPNPFVESNGLQYVTVVCEDCECAIIGNIYQNPELLIPLSDEVEQGKDGEKNEKNYQIINSASCFD